MPLPHYSKSTASSNNYEPVQGNLFEVTFIPPAGIDGGILLEHVNNVSGLDALNPAIEPVGQKYKFSDRSYAGMPGQTFVDVAVNFSLNLNNANEFYVYKILRDWYKRMYDPQTGEMGVKNDYVGQLIIVQHNRPGDIFRKVTLKDAFISGNPTGLDSLDYTAPDPLTLDITWRSDHWKEELV